MKLTNNFMFLICFKWVLILLFVTILFITAVYFHDVFEMLYEYHFFDIAFCILIIFAVLCFVQTMRILKQKDNKEKKLI